MVDRSGEMIAQRDKEIADLREQVKRLDAANVAKMQDIDNLKRERDRLAAQVRRMHNGDWSDWKQGEEMMAKLKEERDLARAEVERLQEVCEEARWRD